MVSVKRAKKTGKSRQCPTGDHARLKAEIERLLGDLMKASRRFGLNYETVCSLVFKVHPRGVYQGTLAALRAGGIADEFLHFLER